MKLSKPLQDELNEKGRFKLFLEALCLIGAIAASYGLLLLLNVYAQTQGA